MDLVNFANNLSLRRPRCQKVSFKKRPVITRYCLGQCGCPFYQLTPFRLAGLNIGHERTIYPSTIRPESPSNTFENPAHSARRWIGARDAGKHEGAAAQHAALQRAAPDGGGGTDAART